MFLHTNLLGRRVLVHEDQEYGGRTAVIVTVWLDVQSNQPLYTLAVQIPDEPLRVLWNCGAEAFGANK